MFRRWFWRLRSLLHFSPVTIRIVAVCFCVHLVLGVANRVEFFYGCSYGSPLFSCFSLNWSLLSKGFLWQPISYMFLHDNWWHLILNMWGCLLFGSLLERDHGSRFFLKVFLIGGVMGAAGWLAYTALLPYLSFMIPLTGWIPNALKSLLHAGEGLKGSLQSSVCIGASGGVFALIGCYLAMYPRRELYVLLFFVIPLRVRAGRLTWIILALLFIDTIFIQSPIANAAHLFGGLFGWFCGWRMDATKCRVTTCGGD